MAWYSPSWDYRFKVTIDNTKVAANLTIDVLITEDNVPAGFWGHVETDGSDIVVTEDDGETKLYRDLIDIDTVAEELQMRVRASILSASDTDLYVYYGNSGASETENQTDAYDSDCLRRYEFEENPATTNLNDRTGTQDGTPQGSMAAGVLTDGKVRGGWDMDGTDDYVEVPGSDIRISHPVTLIVWAKADTSATKGCVFTTERRTNGDYSGIWFNADFQTGTQDISAEFGNNAGSTPAERATGYNNGETYTNGTWYQLAYVVVDHNDITLYKNGSSIATTYSGSYTGNPTYQGENGAVGVDIDGGVFVGHPLDMLGFYSREVSANEILTRFNNENDPSSFYSIGAEEVPQEDVSATLGDVHITGFASTVEADVDTDVTATLGDVHIDGYLSSVAADVDTDVEASLGDVHITGLNASPVIDVDNDVIASVGIVEISGSLARILLEYDYLQVSGTDTRQRCDVCSDVTKIKDLVRTQVRYLLPAGSNYLAYSSYNSSGWSCSARDKGKIGYGPHGDEQRMQIYDDNSLAYARCSQTWGGVGTLRSTSGVDVSSLTTFVFSVDVAQVIRYLDGTGYASDLTVAMGICDSAGNNKSLQKTFTSVNSLLRCWFKMDVTDIAAPLASNDVYVYITVTPDTEHEYWLADDMSIEANVSIPDQFITTTGTAISNQTATKSMSMLKVCPRCREALLLESEQYGRPQEQRAWPTVQSDPQQV